MAIFEEWEVPFKEEKKLIVRGEGPYKIMHNVGDNAYKHLRHF